MFIVFVGFYVYMGLVKIIVKGVVWVYDKVVINIYNVYSVIIGKFIILEQGLYIFFIDILSDLGKVLYVGFYVDGKIRSW